MAKTDTNPEVKTKSRPFPPWSPFLAGFMVVATYFGASIIGEVILQIYAALHHFSSRTAEAWLTSSAYAEFSGFAVIYGVMALAIYLFTRGYGVSLRTLGMVRPRLKDIGIALLGVPVYIGGYFILSIAAKIIFPSLDVEQQQQLGFQVTHDAVGRVLIFVSLVILPPLVEELLMRGFLFTSLLKKLQFVPAALVTSVIFAAAHLQFGSGAPLLWIAAIDTFMLSLVLCYMRFKTGSLWPGIYLHGLKNLVAFLSIFVFSVS
jgi:membrane protease YdiL (CAAX protease family)